MAEKNSKWPIYCDFSHFTPIIWPCGRNNDFKFNNGGGLLSSVLLFYIEPLQYIRGEFVVGLSLLYTWHNRDAKLKKKWCLIFIALNSAF